MNVTYKLRQTIDFNGKGIAHPYEINSIRKAELFAFIFMIMLLILERKSVIQLLRFILAFIVDVDIVYFNFVIFRHGNYIVTDRQVSIIMKYRILYTMYLTFYLGVCSLPREIMFLK